MGYKVVIADGPAQGWSYETGILPDPVIVVAPVRGDALYPWVRVLLDCEPWPDQVEYERRDVKARTISDLRAAITDGLVVEYRQVRA